ncbi:MAG TPA: HIT family protein [Gaiellaceae bacterium]
MIAELDATWATAGAEAPLPGYVCVVSRRHVVEPYELPPDEMEAFWREAMHVARAVAAVVEPAKMNYEIHGNTIPHLHMHLFPRFAGDPYEGGPIDPNRATFARSPADLEHLAAAIAAARL